LAGVTGGVAQFLVVRRQFIMESHPPILLVEFVSIDSKMQPHDIVLLRESLTEIHKKGVYELPDKVCIFPPDTSLTVKAIYHADTREIILGVSCHGKLLVGLIAIAHDIFEVSSSVKTDIDLRITLVRDTYAA
jgi:hypothetical protein